MAGMMGWSPRDLEAASLAEMMLMFDGHAAAQGWHAAAGPAPMTRAELRELMERYPDG